MRLKLVLGFILATFVTAPAAAATWFQLGSGDTEVFYADRDSIQRHDNITQITAFHGYSDSRSGDTGIHYERSHLEFDCSAHKVRQLAVDDYDSKRHPLPARRFTTEWTAFAAGSAEYGFGRVACNGLKLEVWFEDPFWATDFYWEHVDDEDDDYDY